MTIDELPAIQETPPLLTLAERQVLEQVRQAFQHGLDLVDATLKQTDQARLQPQLLLHLIKSANAYLSEWGPVSMIDNFSDDPNYTGE
jgi:hypothetical protein